MKPRHALKLKIECVMKISYASYIESHETSKFDLKEFRRAGNSKPEMKSKVTNYSIFQI